MTARDDLARKVALIIGMTPATHPRDIADQVADAVIREWLPTLIENEPLMRRVAEVDYGKHRGFEQPFDSDDWTTEAEQVTRALAAALRGDA